MPRAEEVTNLPAGAGGEEEEEEDDEYRKMSFPALFFMAFFWVCGGIYGNEAMITLAPSGFVFTTLAVTTLLYALPLALMNAELACAIPVDGGLVVWIQESLGRSIGGHNAWWVWCSYTFDSAIYPVLAASYMTDAMGTKSYFVNVLLAELIVGSVTVVKLFSAEMLERLTTISGMVSLAPAVVFVFWGVCTLKLKPGDLWLWDLSGEALDASENLTSSLSSVDDEPKDVTWELLISWMLWTNAGYVGLGSLAASVDNPKRTFPLLVGTLMPFVVCVIVSPFIVSLAIDDDISHYKAGYFSSLAEQVGGEWLKTSFLLASVICLIGLYSSIIVTSEVSMQYFVEERFQDAVNDYEKEPTTPREIWKRWLLHHDDAGAARIYVVASGAVAGILVLIPYEVLITFTMTLMAIPTILFLVAFVLLREQQPDLSRDFAIPGPTWVQALVALPPAGLTIFQFVLAIGDNDPEAMLPYPAACAFFLIVGGGGLVHMASSTKEKYRPASKGPQEWQEPLVNGEGSSVSSLLSNKFAL